jgi:serine/threonine-protein kinase
MRELAPDTVIDDRYVILQRLGSGGMADVYCAQDTQLGRKVALKLLYQRFAEDQEFVERFRREASSAAGLAHPNVVSVFDRGAWDGTYYIAMEYLDGRSLKEIVRDEGPLEPERAIDVVVQILRAARFAHRRGVIHRDLKPHNVIVDSEGRAKVTDFGIARAGASDMTQTGSIMGTAQYLSPEQAQGIAVSAASDLYSIGIILYELLTGRVPFDGESAVTIALKQVSEPPVPPTVHNRAVSAELEAVVLRALEKEPHQRFGDADEFIAALESARPGVAAAGADGGSTAEFAAADVAAGAVPPTDATQVVTAARDLPIFPAEPLPPPERRERRWGVAALLAGLALLLAALAIFALPALTRDKARVPDVVGQQVLAASTILRNQGFDVDIERVNHDDAAKNTVLRQDPGSGERVEKGSTINLTVSDGPATKGVPDVVGKGRREARRILRRAGFRVKEVEESSDTVSRDRVTRTSPPATGEAPEGSTVTIFVSTGKERVAVPGVVGDELEEARRALEGAGLSVSVRERDDDEADPGTVLEQDPAAGTEVEKGSSVELVVAKESERVEIPDVTGTAQDDAVSELSALGLAVSTSRQAVDDADLDGVVLSQSPSAGREVRKGSRVAIVVGRFEEPPDDGGITTPTTTTP